MIKKMDQIDIGDVPFLNAIYHQDENSQINISDVIEVIQTTDPASASAMFRNGEGSTQTPPTTSTNASSHIRQVASVKITEQPAPKALRFRYECEGRSAGSIPGVHSTPDNKTFPSIQVQGYRGKAVVVVSCVTKDPPHKPHPHNLVGKDGCQKGVCTVGINEDTMSVTFSNLGIQCVKKKDIEEALKVRQEIKVDPYKTGFSHRDQPSSIDLNSVRLCFQVFVTYKDEYVPLAPVISEPIYDKKAMSDLVICKLSHSSCSVAGGQEIILLCEKVAKEDIQVRFYEEKDSQVVWEGYGDFQHTNVHKQTAIAFRSPRYRTLEVDHVVKAFIQLKRPSDGTLSDPLPFDYIPLDSGRKTFWSLRQGLNLNKRKTSTSLEETFQQILATDREMFPEKGQNTSQEVIVVEDIPVEVVEVVEIPPEKTLEPPVDLEQQKIANEKITEWMKSSEFDQAIGRNESGQDDVDKTLNELLDQVAELDEIYTDHQLRQHSIIENELSALDNSLPKLSGKEDSMDIDDIFDDAATYTSLQKAFKNPITIPMDELTVPPPRPPHSSNFYDHVEQVIINPPAPVIDISPSKTDDSEKLPPLPPKRIKKTPGSTPSHDPQDKENDSSKMIGSDMESGLSSFSNSRRSSTRSLTPRPPSQIIIMKTPEPGQRPASPSSQSNTLPKQKKPGFFSKLFSRRKSKGEVGSPSSNKTSPNISREPSVLNFSPSDPNRASVRSLKVPSATRKTGKPVARSASSVSGKRPHLSPDIIHIPLKGESSNSLNFRSGSGSHLFPHSDLYERASTITLNNNDRKTMSALQLADLPLQDGNMELIAIADAQSLRNLCEGQYGVQLDPSVDLTEAEHYALYTSVAPHATQSEFDETSAYYAPVEAGEILTPAEVARRLTNNL